MIGCRNETDREGILDRELEKVNYGVSKPTAETCLSVSFTHLDSNEGKGTRTQSDVETARASLTKRLCVKSTVEGRMHSDVLVGESCVVHEREHGDMRAQPKHGPS